MTTILDGKKLAEALQEELKEEIAQSDIQPLLAVVLVGNNPASEIYVRNKEKSAKKVGMISQTIRLKETITEEELLAVVDELNKDEKVDGILVQLPLPSHLKEEVILEKITPEKDVDGFHPYNVGKLLQGKPMMVPSTPYGIMNLLDHYQISVAGKHAVVVGRSNIVGKPMAQLLLQANATVTIAHSKTKNLQEITKSADILVVAIGQREFIKGDDVKEGAVVIDVGMNRKEDGKLTGDVDFSEVSQKASFITPVPKGVGPMTITSLLQQTFLAAKRRKGK